MAAEFKFMFVAMGQGDCTIVRCPDGKIVVVDCGRTAIGLGYTTWFDEAAVALRDNNWAGGNGNKIDALILTHPDADHYNMVVELCRPLQWTQPVYFPYTKQLIQPPDQPKVEIGWIYISKSRSNSPLYKYKKGGLPSNIYNHEFKTWGIDDVHINSTTNSKNKSKRFLKLLDFKDSIEINVDDGQQTVLKGSTDLEDWSVKIVAGNVPKGYGGVNDTATPNNAGSLITLFEVEGKKVLLTGDATFSTERFLNDKHADLLKDIEFVQVPHHGSQHASSFSFVNNINPKAGIVSVGFYEHSYRFPVDVPVNRWRAKINAFPKINDHSDDTWSRNSGDNGKPTANDWVNSWESANLEVYYNSSNTFAYLAIPNDNDVNAVYAAQGGDSFLKRIVTDMHLVMTSQGTQLYTLGSGGMRQEV